MPQEILGLIAGNGKFPLLFAREAKLKNKRIIAAAVHGDTSWFLRFFVDQIQWFNVGELKGLLDYFQKENVRDVIMAGQVNPNNLFDENLKLDDEFRKVYDALKDRKADTIFRSIADVLSNHKMTLLDSTALLTDYMAPSGTLTKRGPTLSELSDIEFGRTIAKLMGGIDIGQTVVIKEKAIVAIEAMEGTDKAIVRGGMIARKDAVIVKMSKPKQDQRFDVPVIGPRTIERMIQAKASCLAIESGKTLIIDRTKCVKLADQAGICIVSS